MGIQKILEWLKKQYFRLNQKQREHVSKICHVLGLVSTAPLVIRILSNEKAGDDWLAAVGIVYAIIFEVMAIAALATKEGE